MMDSLRHDPLTASLFGLAAAFRRLRRRRIAGEPLQLVDLSAWFDTGAWALADDIQGSSQEMKWKSVKPGKAILFNGAEGKSVNLKSKGVHGDAEVEVEFLIPKSSNSGLYLMGRYEVQILDSYGKADNAITVHDCGAIYERWDESKPKGSQDTRAPRPRRTPAAPPVPGRLTRSFSARLV